MSRPFRLTAPRASENDIEAGCITILEMHNYWVVKLHAGVFKSLDDRRHVHGVKKGTPDYICAHEFHRNFLLEVKRPGGVLSPDQEAQIAFLQLKYRLPIVVVESAEALCNFLAQHERPSRSP
ncbi:MAG TPA: VRR-NUC domain-containing protein [Rhizomicrobium sp.]|jgi:hypothetical protein